MGTQSETGHRDTETPRKKFLLCVSVSLWLIPLCVLCTLCVVAAQTTQAPSTKLPPMSYVCPMPGDEEVIEDKPGRCRKCGMELVPARLDSVWTCATRPLVVVESKPGRCPVDGTPLVQVTASVTWTCADRPSTNAL